MAMKRFDISKGARAPGEKMYICLEDPLIATEREFEHAQRYVGSAVEMSRNGHVDLDEKSVKNLFKENLAYRFVFE